MSEDSTPQNYASLAERLRAKQQDDEREIESIMQEHAESLRQRSNTVLAEIDNDLESFRSQTRQRLRRSVLPLALIWTAALTGVLIALGATWYASSQIEQPNLHIRTCNGQACVKIKPHSGTYGPNHDYRIIQE